MTKSHLNKIRSPTKPTAPPNLVPRRVTGSSGLEFWEPQNNTPQNISRPDAIKAMKNPFIVPPGFCLGRLHKTDFEMFAREIHGPQQSKSKQVGNLINNWTPRRCVYHLKKSETKKKSLKFDEDDEFKSSSRSA